MMKALDREYTSQISKRAIEQKVMRTELDEILYQVSEGGSRLLVESLTPCDR